MPAKYQYNIIAPNLRGATILLTATKLYIITLAKEAKMYKRNGYFMSYEIWVNRCKELFDIYRQIKKQWSKMEY